MNYSLKKIKRDTGKVYVLGDLHGCYTALMKHLKLIGFDFEKDLVISVGDLIDRGTENVKCLELMSKPWFESVRGNHELLAHTGAVLGDKRYYDCWCGNGGWWLSYLKGSDDYYWALDLIRDTMMLPDIIELVRNGKTYIVCHADYPRSEYLSGEDLTDAEVDSVKWSRDRVDRINAGYVESIGGAHHFFFGHTPIEQVLTVGNITYVDTGLVRGGGVGLADVDEY